MNIFVIGFLIFFATSNIYLGSRFMSAFKNIIPVPVWLIGLIWAFVALCSIIFRNEVSFLPGAVSDFFYLVGAYWIALMYYGLMIVVLCDIVAFLQNITGIHIFRQSMQTTGCIVLVILFVLMAYGTYNAATPRVTNYTINIDKAAQTDKMRVVLVSDLYLGKINDGRLVDKIIALANPLNPDIILFAGDTFDSDINSVYRKQPLNGIKDLQSKYGVYAIMGNHEYILSEGNSMAAYLQESGVNILIDSYVKLPNGVIIYGRDDYSIAEKTLIFLQ